MPIDILKEQALMGESIKRALMRLSPEFKEGIKQYSIYLDSCKITLIQHSKKVVSRINLSIVLIIEYCSAQKAVRK